MYRNTVKEKLLNKMPVLGCIVQGALPALVEIIGLTGFDFVFLDCEHGASSLRDCEEAVKTAEARRLIPLVRVPRNSPDTILQHMDIGAMGIILPGIETKADAEKAVRSAKYYPLGQRGLGSTRASDFGLTMPRHDYVQMANEETMVWAIIESAAGVENCEEIIAAKGVDAVLVGPTDLSQSLGVPGSTDHPLVKDAFEKVLKAGLKQGKPVGVTVRSGESARQYFEKGVSIAIITAFSLFASAAKDFVKNAKPV